MDYVRGKKTDPDYETMLAQARAFAEEESWYVALLSNVSALIYDEMPDLNWAGFYLTRKDELILGPFQGRPACIRIPFGKGVCGTAAVENRTIVVSDVHQFPGHIACDSASNSEIVIPLRRGGKVIGVMDIDSPKLERFSDRDREGLERIAGLIEMEMTGIEISLPICLGGALYPCDDSVPGRSVLQIQMKKRIDKGEIISQEGIIHPPLLHDAACH